jgi:hypothetical protein
MLAIANLFHKLTGEKYAEANVRRRNGNSFLLDRSCQRVKLRG